MSVAREELLPQQRLRWLARLHLIGLAGVAVLAVIGAWRIPGLAIGPLLAVVVITAACELALMWYLARREGEPPAEIKTRLIYGQLILDILALTTALYFTGGAENPFFPFYVIPVILAAALLTRRTTFGFAAAATILYAGLLIAEALGWLPHHSLSGLQDPVAYRRWTYLAGLVLSLGGTLFVTAEAASTLMDALRARARELAESHERMATRAEELRRLNDQLSGANLEYKHSREHMDDLYVELQQAYTRLETRSRNMSELNERLRQANAECKARREELGTVYAQVQEAYRRLETRSEHMRELNEQLRVANSECSRQRNELAQLNNQLLQANAKLSALEDARAQFTLLVTHELRAPVAAIQSYLKLILEGYVPPAKVQETLEKAEKRAMEQLALIADLLELGRIQSADARGKVEPVQIDRALLEQMDLMAARAQERDISIHTDVDPDLPEVIANNDQIRSVWNNLISNAIKYNRDGGHVEISLKREGERIVGAVSDTGIGIPPEAMSRLFSEFFRADNAKAASRMGTGLGLSIVKEIIEHGGGEIICESVIDQGTTFRFWLPIIARPAVETALAAEG